jgi:hypothetical protein
MPDTPFTNPTLDAQAHGVTGHETADAHRKAADHHEQAARHHREAAKAHDDGAVDLASHHANLAFGDGADAQHHARDAMKHYTDS